MPNHLHQPQRDQLLRTVEVIEHQLAKRKSHLDNRCLKNYNKIFNCSQDQNDILNLNSDLEMLQYGNMQKIYN